MEYLGEHHQVGRRLHEDGHLILFHRIPRALLLDGVLQPTSNKIGHRSL